MIDRSWLGAATGSAAGSAVQAALIAALVLVHPGAGTGSGGLAYAQDTQEASESGAASLSHEQMEELVGPIALYPDDLLGLVLPASTYPLQIVQASRFLEKYEKDESLEPDEEWDTSVIGLLNYPDVVDMMNEDLDWTWKLGDAVANQQEDVMDAIQGFRERVDQAGNLESNDKVKVVKEEEDDKQIIVIESASPDVIYVPSYQPTTVVVHQTTPYPYAYSSPYPPYWSTAAAFWTGLFVGSAVSYGVRWGGYGAARGGIYVDGDVNIGNRNTNINRSNVNSGNRTAWKADRSRGSQAGGRPGGARPGTSDRAAARPGGAGRPSARDAGSRDMASRDRGRDKGSRDAGARNMGSRDAGSRGLGSSSGRDRSSSSRSLTSQSARRSSSSLGSYRSGASSRSASARGHASRGGGSRGGGGRRR